MSGLAHVWGLPLSPLTRRRTVDAAMALMDSGRPEYFITANTNYAMLMEEHPKLAAVNDRAAFIVADGAPLVWASRRGRVPLPERVAGSDLIYDLCEELARRDKSLFLLGGGEGVAVEAARKFEGLYPGLRIVGTACPSRADMAGPGPGHDRIFEQVHAARPDFLILALSQPFGDFWLFDHVDRLDVPATVQLGASLDFVVGRVPRAPKLWQKLGMEWAYRIKTDPKRLAPRYARNARFILSRVARELARRPERAPVEQPQYDRK